MKKLISTILVIVFLGAPLGCARKPFRVPESDTISQEDYDRLSKGIKRRKVASIISYVVGAPLIGGGTAIIVATAGRKKSEDEFIDLSGLAYAMGGTLIGAGVAMIIPGMLYYFSAKKKERQLSTKRITPVYDPDEFTIPETP